LVIVAQWEGSLGGVFRLTPKPNGEWTTTCLHNFTGGKDGSFPQDGVVFDRAGNLYGTTYFGGNQDLGVVFQIRP
jgi:uncharacterized repeat protein (TIGR03803 family)